MREELVTIIAPPVFKEVIIFLLEYLVRDDFTMPGRSELWRKLL